MLSLRKVRISLILNYGMRDEREIVHQIRMRFIRLESVARRAAGFSQAWTQSAQIDSVTGSYLRSFGKINGYGLTPRWGQNSEAARTRNV